MYKNLYERPMKQISILILAFLIFNSCKQNIRKEYKENSKKIEYEHIYTSEYQLYKPNSKPKAVLVLFGGYPEVAEDIKREFKILKKAKENEIAIVYSNYNKKLWLEEEDLKTLAKQLQTIFTNNKLPNDNLYLGGFSSGGNVALLIGDYLTENNRIALKPKGVFIVDAPIDLAALYFSAEKNIKRNFSEPSVQESTWLIESLGNSFGNPNDDLTQYERYSVYSSKTENINNIKNLENTKIRMYTEPDTIWWKENRMADYDQMNSCYIKKLSEKLEKQGFRNVEYIPTENKGYRANGERHPHSWGIVDVDDLTKWMLSK